MKLSKSAVCISVAGCLLACLTFFTCAVSAETIRLSCSNQMYTAFEKEKIAAFKKATGITVEVLQVSSDAAVSRMMGGFSDIAATATDLGPRHADYGFTKVPVCRDAIAIVVKKGCGASNLTDEQVRGIFSGSITNWKSVGGADLPITVVVPNQETAAQKNFLRLAMKNAALKEDIVTKNSTMVLEILKNFPCGAVSFISYAAALRYPELTSLNFNGKAPSDDSYPFQQNYYYVTKGPLQGNIKKFVDFTFSDDNSLLKKNGLHPLSH